MCCIVCIGVLLVTLHIYSDTEYLCNGMGGGGGVLTHLT